MLESAVLSRIRSNPSTTVGDPRSWIELGSAAIPMRFTTPSRVSIESSICSAGKSAAGARDIKKIPINASAILCPINQSPIESPFSIRVARIVNDSRPEVVSKEVHRCLIGKYLHSPIADIVGPSFVIFSTTVSVV